jgi:hypothetical protein
LPWAWPRDCRRETLEGAGIALAQQHKAQGINMLHDHAQFENKSVFSRGRANGHADANATGRFKVFKYLNDL